MKQRFSSLDVKVIAHELNASLCSLRVSNIYDLSTRILLFKFQKPNVKEQLLIDIGFRCHLTSFTRATAAAPSPFVQKLRKFLKTRRVTKVAQVGTDRVIEIEFSEGLYRLYLEFYAAGNVLLVDGENTVLALTRNVNEGEEHETLRVGLKYDLSLRQNINGIPELTKTRIKAGLQKAVDRKQAGTSTESKVKGSKKDAQNVLRKSLAVSISEFPPILVDHAMKVRQFDPTIQPEEVLSSEELLDKLLDVLQEAQRVVAEITGSVTARGYILAKSSSPQKKESEDAPSAETPGSGLLYEDFHPFKPAQLAEKADFQFLEFDGYNKTVDKFFSSIEGQKLESRLHEREEAARKRMEQAKLEHERRIGGLQQAQELNIQRAESILANVERVQEAQNAINGLIGQGMDWVDIARLIETEQSKGNAVAQMIKLPLKLYENTATLLLSPAEAVGEDDDFGYYDSESGSDSDSESDEDETRKVDSSKSPQDTRLIVDIDLALTPWANASQYYDQKKNAAVKETKTMQASTQALKSAERKIAADLKKGLEQEKEVLRPTRKQYWFEKFYYFISSDGYMVVAGKDAQQNEQLYKKYLRKGDVYVHADLHGAASVVIKNNPATPDAPIPPSTLSQAGSFSVSTSSAWDSKAVMSAYWVNADQVSKTAPTGEYLTTGGFMIRGQKNYLPPAQLLLGFAVMWQISEESKVNHSKHRFHDQGIAELDADEHPGALNGQSAVSEDKVKSTDDSEDEYEEDFPDATVPTAHADSDDEDFPDAKLGQDEIDSDSDEDGGQARSSNPLQTSSYAHKKEESPLGTSVSAQSNRQSEGEDDSGDDTEREEAIGSQSTETRSPGSRPLTLAERKNLRAGDQNSSPDTSGRSTPSQPQPKQKAQQLPRGKRGKLKKAAAKYADQDPEEREMAMRILGSKTGQDAAAEAVAAKKAKAEEEEMQKQRRREQHLKAQEAGRAAEAARQARLDRKNGDVDVGAEDAEDDLIAQLEEVGLDNFTGKPRPGDELLAAIPICAPWNALSTYKYKVKLQPGTLKKGKAASQILDAWLRDGKDVKKVDKQSEDMEKMWPREVELLRGWKSPEILGVLPVKGVRIMMPGGSDNKAGGGGKGKGGKAGGSKPKKGGKKK